MALYLKTKKVDLSTGDPLVIMINNKDAVDYGVRQGQKLEFTWRDLELYVVVNLTNTEVESGEVGLYNELWEKYDIPSEETVIVKVFDRPHSIDSIVKKLRGEKLNKDEIMEIMTDISERKIREVESAYFMSCFFNPGFDDEEVANIALGMAAAGDILSFRNIRDNGEMVVDKHSIGGIAGKGITPILVPIIAAAGLVIPNTSTRAITTPGGTSDILETVMPIAFTNEKVLEVVKKAGACMIWGGSLKLAPADDVLISVEKDLHAQSYSKLIASIVAKKISMGISHILIDIPYGKSAKVKTPDDAQMLSKRFVKLFEKVGIKCETYTRFVVEPDSNGIGPVLEMRDILYVLERHERRAKTLEKTTLDMAGQLLEISGKAECGKGKKMAMEILETGKALSKFWEIAQAQGATKVVKSDEMIPGEYSYQLMADHSGRISFIDNHEIVGICRALGNPFVKEAGMYFHKCVGDKVQKGENIVTIYATSMDRLELGRQEVDMSKLVIY